MLTWRTSGATFTMFTDGVTSVVSAGGAVKIRMDEGLGAIVSLPFLRM